MALRRATALVATQALLALCAGAPLAAEEKPVKPQAPVAAPSGDAPLPYEPQLLRLSELIGALVYLRDLCGDGDGERFRDKMKAMLDAEAPGPARREALAGAFNKGLSDYAMTYRVCTPNARAVMERYLAEMARLATDVANRYGG